MAEILQKVNRNEKSICGKCSHRFVCVGINNQPCFECNQFTEEVVRCKDCKYFITKADGTVGFCKCGEVCGYLTTMRVADDFCSYGERKGDGNA